MEKKKKRLVGLLLTISLLFIIMGGIILSIISPNFARGFAPGLGLVLSIDIIYEHIRSTKT